MDFLGACILLIFAGFAFQKLMTLIPNNVTAIVMVLFSLWLVALFVITIASFIHPDVLPAIANLFV